MTPNEIILLLLGFGIGVQAMVVWHMVADMRAARRAQSESHQAWRRAVGDHYLNSFRLYRLQHRERA